MITKFLPHNLLRDHVSLFWILELEANDSPPIEERLIPGGTSRLVINLEEGISQTNNFGEWEKLPKIFVEGVYNNHFFIKSNAGTKAIGIDFKPGKLNSFSNYRFEDYVTNIVPAEELFGTISTMHLISKLLENDSFDWIVTTLNNFLLDHFNSRDDRINKMADYIIANRGAIDIHKFGNQAFICERQFRRVFKDKLGLNPKLFSRIIKIENIINDMINDRFCTFTRAAHSYGYHDQAHFIKDFRKIVGVTPRQYMSESNMFDTSMYNSEMRR